MMDRFEPVSGQSVIAQNVKSLNLREVTIVGEDVDEPLITGVEKEMTEGLIFEEKEAL